MQDSNAPDLQHRMAAVREDLERNAACFKENAQTLADWRYYVRRYPWLAMAAAGAVGFLLVPKRSQPPTPTAEALAQLAREHGFVLQDKSQRNGSGGVLGGLTSMITRTLLRTGTAYVAQHVGQILAARMDSRPRAPEPREEATSGAAH